MEALRAHGVETLGELAALTASQQEELLASVPRTIVSQLKRMGGLEAMVDQAKKERDDHVKKEMKRMNDQGETNFRNHEVAFESRVSTARREYAGVLAVEELGHSDVARQQVTACAIARRTGPSLLGPALWTVKLPKRAAENRR